MTAVLTGVSSPISRTALNDYKGRKKKGRKKKGRKKNLFHARHRVIYFRNIRAGLHLYARGYARFCACLFRVEDRFLWSLVS